MPSNVVMRLSKSPKLSICRIVDIYTSQHRLESAQRKGGCRCRGVSLSPVQCTVYSVQCTVWHCTGSGHRQRSAGQDRDSECQAPGQLLHADTRHISQLSAEYSQYSVPRHTASSMVLKTVVGNSKYPLQIK